MKVFVRALVLFALSICGLKAVDYPQFLTMGTDTTLGNQTGWAFVFTETSHLYGLSRPNTTSSTNVSGSLVFPNTVTAGNYRMWIKVQSFSALNTSNLLVSIDTGAGPFVATPYDRSPPPDGAWTELGYHIVPADTNAFHVNMSMVGAVAMGQSPGIAGMFITQDPSGIVTLDDFFQHWEYPTAMVTNAPIAGNYVPNGSFENGTGDFSIFPNTAKMWPYSMMWSTLDAHSGTHALQLVTTVPGYTNFNTALRTKSFLVRSNKTHSAGMWVKGDLGDTVELRIIPVVNFLTGYGFTAPTNYSSGNITLGTTNWFQVKAENMSLLEYPAPAQYALQVLITTPSATQTRTNKFFDDFWFGEGATVPAYAPRLPIELQLRTAIIGNRFYYENNDSSVIVSIYNSTGSPSTETVNYEIYNSKFQRIVNSTMSVACAAGATTEATIDLNALPFGPFRIGAWLSNGSESETYVSRMRTPRVIPREDSMFGGHVDSWLYAADIANGVRWHRVYSPVASYRWSFLEPTAGVWDWVGADAAMDRLVLVGQELLMVLPYFGASHALRTFFPTTQPSAPFVIGETITQASPGPVTAKITWIGTTNNLTGCALQVSNVVGGTFTNTGTIVGGTSGATATLTFSPNSTTPAIDGYTNYVREVVSRYRPRGAKYYGGPNEPQLDSSMPNYGVTNYGFYAELLKSYVAAGRAACPDCKFIGLGGVSLESEVTNILSRLSPVTLTNLHAVDLHFYGLTYEQGRAQACVAAAALFGITNVWNTESGETSYSQWWGSGANWRDNGVAILQYRDSEDQLRSYTSALIQYPATEIYSIGSGMKKHFYYDSRWFHQYGDASQSFNGHLTEIDLQDTLKPPGVGVRFIAWALEGGRGNGRVATPAASVAYSFTVGASSWFSFRDLTTNRVMSWPLGPSSYEIYDLFGNRLTQPPGEVHFNKFPVMVKATGCSTAAQLNAAIAGASWTTEADTSAPGLVIAKAPMPTVTPLEKHRVRMRWLAWDDYYLAADRLHGTDYRSKLDAEAFSVWDGTTHRELDGLSSGSHTFVVEAKDEAGNTSTASRTFTIP